MEVTPDFNGVIAALLHDLAFVQKETPSRNGYKRAAAAVFTLDVPVETLRRGPDRMDKILHVGPKSERVIFEVLDSGRSPTVESAVAASGKAPEIERRRKLREHFLSRAQVARVLAMPRAPDAISLASYRGDFQMHSTWSDGVSSIAEIAAAAVERGWTHCAVTDHTEGLRIAGGLSREEFAQQHREIDAVNETYAGRFQMLRGAEANIATDGSVDLSPAELARLEVVVAAPHSALRSTEDQTARMVTAVRTPGVHILGHPRGRMYGARLGVVAEWDEVFGVAAERGVAIEIDGDPARQDLDFSVARRAVNAGCVLALDSDAHSVRQFWYTETAMAHAVLADVPPDRVINCWARERLLDWLER